MSESNRQNTFAQIADNIRDEIHYAGTGKICRERLTTELHGIYGKTLLAQSLRALANSAARYQSLVPAAPDSSDSIAKHYPAAFYTGSLLSLRGILHPDLLDRATRQRILGATYYLVREDSQNLQEDMLQHIAHAGELLDVCQTQALTLKPILSDVLVEAATNAFKDYPPKAASEYENRFVLGFYMGVHVIGGLFNVMQESLADETEQ